MFKKIIFIAAMLVANTSIAGQDGHGGYGIKCGEKVTILDLYEAKTRYTDNEGHYLKVDLGPTNLSVDAKVEILMKRFEKINKEAATKYRGQLKSWDKIAGPLDGQTIIHDNDMVLGQQVVSTLDVGNAIIPKGCKPVQLARNIDLKSLTQKNIFLYVDAYSLDNDSMAALRVHEIIYFDKKQTDSEDLRKLIALLSSSNLDKMSKAQQVAYFKPNEKDREKEFYLFREDINNTSFSFAWIDPDTIVENADKTFIQSFQSPSYSLVVNSEAMGSVQTLNLLGKKLEIMPVWNSYKRNAAEYLFSYEFLSKDIPKNFNFRPSYDCAQLKQVPCRDAYETSPDTVLAFNFANGVVSFRAIYSLTENDSTNINLYTPTTIHSLNNLMDMNLKYKNFYTSHAAQMVLKFYPNQKLKSIEDLGYNQKSIKTDVDGKTRDYSFVGFDENENLIEWHANNIPTHTNVGDILVSYYHNFGDFVVLLGAMSENAIATPNIRNAVFHDGSFLRLSPSGKLVCATIGNAVEKYSIRVNGVWKAFNDGSFHNVEFNADGVPVSLDTCKVEVPEENK